MDCQFGALGELAEQLDTAFQKLDDQIKKVQNKINSIPKMVDAELAAELEKVKKFLKEEFRIPSLEDLKVALPEELKTAIQTAKDAAAFASEVEKLADKYKDAPTELLKDPAKITDMLRDLQGDLNRLCDLVPNFKKNKDGETELRGRGNTKISANMKLGVKLESLVTRQGRRAARRNLKDVLKNVRIEYVDEEGSGKLSKSAWNTYGY
jgi:hypothetical protein